MNNYYNDPYNTYDSFHTQSDCIENIYSKLDKKIISLNDNFIYDKNILTKKIDILTKKIDLLQEENKKLNNKLNKLLNYINLPWYKKIFIKNKLFFEIL